uniref:Uncharacterized protein n=1 Tax=Mustela putorius furo TaxID=9669 RepID=M3Z4P0_MUSPF
MRDRVPAPVRAVTHPGSAEISSRKRDFETHENSQSFFRETLALQPPLLLAGERPTSGSRTGRPEARVGAPQAVRAPRTSPSLTSAPSTRPLEGPPRRPAPQAAASCPPSPGCERLEAAQHRGGRSRSRRRRPLRAPRGAPLAAILLSPGTRSAAEAFFCGRARSCKGRTGSRRPAASAGNSRKQAGAGGGEEGTPPGATRRAGHTTSCDLASPSPEEAQQSVQPARRVPSLHLQASSCTEPGHGQNHLPTRAPAEAATSPQPVPTLRRTQTHSGLRAGLGRFLPRKGACAGRGSRGQGPAPAARDKNTFQAQEVSSSNKELQGRKGGRPQAFLRETSNFLQRDPCLLPSAGQRKP